MPTLHKPQTSVVTSISLPGDLVLKISRRVRDLKRAHKVHSKSDYFTKLAVRDIEGAKAAAVAAPPAE